MNQIGPYRIERELARGGMGVVYKASGADGRDVALKLLLAHRAANPHARRRFGVEVQALARLRHPGVVPILAAGEHQGAPWLALEFVEGETLEDRLRMGPLSIPETIQLAKQLAQALSYVHTCGVLHRDLKPANVLLRTGQALLTDFGLAQDTDASYSRLTASGAFLGTPGYWSPEQARGQTNLIGPHSDVYGLGALLYACLTGYAPVRASTLQEHLAAIEQQRVLAPRAARPEVPGWLNTLCLRCLATDPSERPASADHVARELAAGEASASSGAGLGRPSPRSALIGAGLVVVALLSAGLGWVLLRDSATGEELAQAKPDLEARIEALFAEASELSKQEDYVQAIERYDRILILDSTRALAYSKRGSAKTNLGENEAALEDLGRALELDPQLAVVHYNRAQAYMGLGRREEAIEAYSEFIRREPEDPDGHCDRGTAYLQLKRYEEALADYDRALEIDPSYSTGHFNRGTLNAELQRHEEAIGDFSRALRAKPDFAGAYNNRASAKFALGRVAEAIEDYTSALELDPDVTLPRCSRGLAHAQLGNYAQAIRDYDDALALGLEPQMEQAVRQKRAEAVALLGQ